MSKSEAKLILTFLQECFKRSDGPVRVGGAGICGYELVIVTKLVSSLQSAIRPARVNKTAAQMCIYTLILAERAWSVTRTLVLAVPRRGQRLD